MRLNCDLGESFGHWEMGQDAELMPLIDDANIACGMHAGDPCVIATTLSLAKQYNVRIGAHPGYPDIQGFGRRSMQLSESELRHVLHYQIAALDGMARVQGLTLSYVKPHGALYNDMMATPALLQHIMRVVADYPADLHLTLQANSHWQQQQDIADSLGLRLSFEAFADRVYEDNGALVSRKLPGAVLDAQQSVAQAMGLLDASEVKTRSGKMLKLHADTLCIHGDSPHALTLLEALRRRAE